ncbi:MAG TPA: ATP synthase F0 subunit B [Caldithrix abyssi]|uniref:ATP synthase subunit b n=1 Tax=Caldithrix abyssi TaxID=187145 RepID=A0A7V4WWE2_CALAY|nr:ATP synthase F0 subunit B [Caldithrix abyssi]
MLNLEPGMILWTWITFFIVLIILSKVALKPMLTAIKNREDGIREDLEKARQQREEAEALLQKHQEMLAGAEEEARKLLKENQQMAEKARQELIEKARQESEKLLERAKEEIDQQKESALASLKAEVADLAVGAAEKIILQTLDKDKQKAIVEEYIKTMPKSVNN